MGAACSGALSFHRDRHHIAQEIFLKGFSYLKGVSTLALDRAACTGCRICTEVCPHNLFSVARGKAKILDTDLCMECGACALNCPVRAITVDAGVGCASGMINEWLAAHNIGQNNSTGCC